MTAQPAPEWWEDVGYLAGRELTGQWAGSGVWVILARMMFTHRVMLATPSFPLGEHYCYEDPALARTAFDAWDGGPDNPVKGWTKYHGPTHGTWAFT